MSPPAPTPPRPGRAAALGLAAGMVIGAIYLGARAVLLVRQECGPEVTGDACVYEMTSWNEMARFLSLFAAGLMLVGLGLGVLFRKPKESP